MTVKDRQIHAETGLPAEAFAIVGDRKDPATWKLPHHKRSIVKARRSRLDIEQTVDWRQMGLAVSVLSPRIRGEDRLCAAPEITLEAARHLAEHYRRAGKPLPDAMV